MFLYVFLILFGFVCPINAMSGSELKYNIRSELNETGHRNIQVGMEREIPELSDLSSNASTFNLHLEHCFRAEDDSEIVYMAASTGNQSPRIERNHQGVPSKAEQTHPLDYELFHGAGYYKVHPKVTTWHQAKRVCESENAHLLVLDRDEEVTIVKQLLTRKPEVLFPTWADVWFVGFSDQEQEGRFISVTGKPLVTTNAIKWKSGAPHNERGSGFVYDSDSDCGVVHLRTVELDDAACSAFLPFICEQPL